MKSWILVGVSLISGALASAAVSRTLLREAAATARIEQVAAAPAGAQADGQRPRWAQEPRLAAPGAVVQPEGEETGDAEADAEDGAAGSGAAAAAAQIDYPTEEEARAQRREAMATARAAIRAQPVDARWAPDAQTKLAADLGELGVQVEGVECRTSACVATLEWSSREEAQLEAGSLVRASWQLPCDRRIFLDQAEGDGPYRAEMLIDCESVRARDN